MVVPARSGAIRPLGRNKILLTVASGLLFLIIPFVLILLDPVHLVTKYKLRLAKGTWLESLFQEELPATHIYIYLYNVTNAERFMSGEDTKMKVEEVGPFVYLESYWFENMTFDENEETLTMSPKIKSEFVPELSLADPKDVNLTLPNLPVLSSAIYVSEFPLWVQYAYNQLISVGALKFKPLKVLNVHDYMWGYEEPLLTWCYRIAPGKVYFKTLGLLDRFYDRESDFVVQVKTNTADKFKINWAKKYRHLDMGGYEHVEISEQHFNDTYQAYLFPPDLTPDVPIKIYRLGLCKTFDLEFSHSQTMDYGGEGYVYEFSNGTFQSYPEQGDRKLPAGILDISTCYYNLPFGVSKAYFLDTDPKLLDRVEGLSPNRSQIVNQFTIDRKEAVVMNTSLSLQLNMIINDVSFNKEAAKFSDTVIPVVHFELKQVKMGDNTMSKFILVYKIMPWVMLAIEGLDICIGLALLWYAIRSIWLHLQCKGIVLETDTKHVDAPLIKREPAR